MVALTPLPAASVGHDATTNVPASDHPDHHNALAVALNDARSVLGTHLADVSGLLYNVKAAAYGAKGDGITDDTAAINAAIAAAQTAGGGTVLLPRGVYKVTSTLVLSGTVGLAGVGTIDRLTGQPISGLVWGGGTNSAAAVVHVERTTPAPAVVSGIAIRDLVIDGAGDGVSTGAGYGLQLVSVQESDFRNLVIRNCSQNNLLLTTHSHPADPSANHNTMFNTFTRISLTYYCQQPLALDGNSDQGDNTCHNVFVETLADWGVGASTASGIYIANADNNTVLGLYSFKRTTATESVQAWALELVASGAHGSNRFVHVQLNGVLAHSGTQNEMWGYDRGNGQTRPTLQGTARLSWTEQTANATASHYDQPIDFDASSGTSYAARFVANGNWEPVVIDGAAGTGRNLAFDTATVRRWQIAGNDFAESGGNVGTHLDVYRYDDSGNFLNTAVRVERDTGGFDMFGDSRHNACVRFRTAEQLVTVAAAATTDSTIQIPANAVVLAVDARVVTVIPTAATFTVTGTTSGTAFSTAPISTAAGSTDMGTGACPYHNGAAQTVRITPNLTPASATGQVRITVHYYDVQAATS